MSARSARLIIVLSSLGLVMLSTASATTYFVSPTGDDANSGAIGEPWRTINHAFGVAQPGDSILLRAGVYHQLVETARNGAPGAPITLTCYAGEVAYIDGTGITDGRNGLIVAHSFITIVGIKIRNWPDSGVWLQANVGFTVVRGCEIYDCGSCMDLYEGVHHFVIDSVDMHGFAEESHGFDATSHDGTPIYSGLISNSKSHDGGGGNCDGFALGHASGYGSFQDVRDVRFVNCEAYNIGDGFDISGRDIVLENCIAHDTYYGGNYKLWATNPTLINCIGYACGANVELDVGESPPVTATLYNCTFINATNNNIWIQTDSCRLRMFNCIVAGGDNVGIRTEELFQVGVYEGDYNLFHCGNSERMFADPLTDLSLSDFQTGAWTQLSGQDTHSRVVVDGSTIFVDTSRGTLNLRLRSGSSAIDGGTTIVGATPTTDRDGSPRNDGRPDMGAFEFAGSGGIAPGDDVGTDRTVSIAPNPLWDHGAIRATLARRERVTIALYDRLGNRTATIYEGEAGPGNLLLAVDAGVFASGNYTAIVTVGSTMWSLPCVIQK